MAFSTIQPQSVTLDGLLKDKLFEIPKFQRPYSWKTAQRAALFSDLDMLLKDNKRDHFMATIVCLDTNKKEKEGTDEFSRMQIVDGQQRLTTLIILLKTIQLHLEGSQIKKEINEAQKLKKIITRGKKIILLQTNHHSAQMFRDFLVSGKIPNPQEQNTLAEKDVALAVKECQDYISKIAQANRLLDLLSVLKNKLYFIFYTKKV